MPKSTIFIKLTFNVDFKTYYHETSFSFSTRLHSKPVPTLDEEDVFSCIGETALQALERTEL